MTLVLAVLSITIGVVVNDKKKASQRLEETIDFLANYTDPEALADASSPQRRAAVWMAHEDALQRIIPLGGNDEWKLLQRYYTR